MFASIKIAIFTTHTHTHTRVIFTMLFITFYEVKEEEEEVGIFHHRNRDFLKLNFPH